MKELIVNMYSLIPYKHTLIDTKLSVDEIAKLLAKEVAEMSSSIFRQTLFNSLPRIYGKMIPQDYGTRVDLRILLDPLILVLSILLCTALVVGFLLCLVT